MLLEVVAHSSNCSYRNSPNYGISLVLAVAPVRSGLLLPAENSSVVDFGVEPVPSSSSRLILTVGTGLLAGFGFFSARILMFLTGR
jgi:hypothetical protein